MNIIVLRNLLRFIKLIIEEIINHSILSRILNQNKKTELSDNKKLTSFDKLYTGFKLKTCKFVIIKLYYYEQKKRIIYCDILSNNTSIHLYDILHWVRDDRRFGWSTILRSLARNNFIVCYSNKTKKKIMNTSVFIIGFIIFSLYLFGLFYMINYSHKSQEKDLEDDPEYKKQE